MAPPISLLLRIGIAACIVGVAIFLTQSDEQIDVSPKTGVIMQLPETLLGLPGEDQEVSEAERIILPADTEFAKRLYQDGDRFSINAQIVLAGAEKRSIHRPEVCLPGQGWTIKSSRVIEVPIPDADPLKVSMLEIALPVRMGDQTRELPQYFCYWFVGHDTTTPSHLVRIAKTNLDVLLHNTNHRWAYIIVAAPVLEGFVPGGKNSAETQKALLEAIGEIAPQIMRSEDSPNPLAAITKAQAAPSIPPGD